MPRKRFSSTARERVLTRFGHKCAMCQCAITPYTGLEYDHRLPLALGGEDTEANLQPLCKPCHTLKTGGDVTSIRKADRNRRRHNGTEAPSSNPIQSAGFRKAAPQKRATRDLSKSLPPRINPFTRETVR